MKKILCLCIYLCCLTFVLSGCGHPVEEHSHRTVEYSNLTDEATRSELAQLMSEAGISEERQKVFFDHVEQFNGAVSHDGLTQGFEQADFTETKYDPYAMQAEWEAAYPDFLGYNCRITAWGLFGDFLSVSDGALTRDDMILMDLYSLEEDNSVFLEQGEEERFRAFFSTVPTETTADVSVHVKRLQTDLANRKIAFEANDRASLISVVIHDAWDDENNLFIGHVGVLFTADSGELYFVEKLAFEEPYQLTKFKNRTELNDYLMAKYDIDENQPTAPPFIMENDRLLEGYRRIG